MWKILSSKNLLENEYFKVREDKIKKASGDETNYYTLERSDVVNVAGFTADMQLILIRQYRHPVNSTNVEIPAGHIDPNENPEEAAQREFLEETGYKLGRLIKVGECFTSAGFKNNKAHFFVGLDGIKVGEQNLDENEEIEVFLSSIEEALKFIASGDMKDMGSTLGLMLAKEWIDKHEGTS